VLLEGKVTRAESISTEMTKRFPNALNVQVLPAAFMYVRGQNDSAERFWRARANDPNPIIKMSALGNLANFDLLHGKLREARQLSNEVLRLNEARGVPKNPLVESIQAAAIDTWFLEQNDRAVNALDAALRQVPLASLPFERRPYSAFAANYALAGRPDKARALLAQWQEAAKATAYSSIIEPGVHGVMAEILIAEKKPMEAVKEIWKSDSLPDGPASSCPHCNDLDLARAYDLANVPDSAIYYWERYLSEPFLRSPSRDAAYLGGIHKRLGELYEAKGEYAKAESHLTAFVELWKNADPELQPKVADAKRRLAAIDAKKKA
jgi:tetratricopeptide (TPR) repeat protein